MCLQRVRLGEIFSTHVTNAWPLARMDGKVEQNLAPREEHLIAKVAPVFLRFFELRLIIVRPEHVQFQGLPLFCVESANFAGKRALIFFLGGMYPLKVAAQMALRPETEGALGVGAQKDGRVRERVLHFGVLF